jgi:chromosomal replication initiation ATPase DnaA
LGGQLRLKLERPPDFARDRFIVSTANREAAKVLDAWPDGRSGALALVGPAGVGKSHLAWAWAERVGARRLVEDDLNPGRSIDLSGRLLLEDADRAPQGEAFFHLFNKVQQGESCLLLTGRTAPRTWPVEVPDLRSRLNAFQTVDIHEPDDVILRGVLIKLFQERNIRPPPDLLPYLLVRMERSVPGAQAIVAALDEAASADNRPISRALAREILNDETDGDHEGA